MIKWNDITPVRETGSIKTTCPSCSPNRRNKKDRCLSVDFDKGVANCHHCGDFSYRPRGAKKEYTEIEQPKEMDKTVQLSKKLRNWFKSRGISSTTLMDCKITEEVFFHPGAGKELNSVVFNYFENGKIVNKKYRSGGKHFAQIKGAKKIFYGIDDIGSNDECYIVEGEMDKLAMWEIGIRNCISVPNGSGDMEAFKLCEIYLKHVKKFYIAVDMDEKGQQLEREILKRLGKSKCVRVHFKNKDANDDLMEGRLVLEESVKNITEYPVSGTYNSKDVAEDILKRLDQDEEELIRLSDRYFFGFNEIFKLARGQLTTVTGIPGHGKSNFTEWYVLNLIAEHGMKASFFSPEHLPLALHHLIFAEKVIGKGWSKKSKNRMKLSELLEYIEWSSDKLYLTTVEEGRTGDWDWMFEKFEEQLYRYGIDIFVIDAFNQVRMKDGSLNEISDILTRLTMFCQTHEVNIFLIAHPTKMKKVDSADGRFTVFEKPSLYDIKGSGNFADQTHNGITVYRNFSENTTEVICTKLKFRYQGTAGDSRIFRFNMENGRYCSYNKTDDERPLISVQQTVIEEPKDKIDPEGWEVVENLPF